MMYKSQLHFFFTLMTGFVVQGHVYFYFTNPKPVVKITKMVFKINMPFLLGVSDSLYIISSTFSQ